MRVVFDGEIYVHYRFLHLVQEDDRIDVGSCCGGQVNGLCGAAHPGGLGIVTGLHTGDVPVRVEVHEQAPLLADGWEDVVEVSLELGPGPYAITAFEVFEPVEMPEPGSWRVRWHASGMDAAADMDVRLSGAAAVDRYLMQMWPERPAGDVILRQTSERAGYWHRVARETRSRRPPR